MIFSYGGSLRGTSHERNGAVCQDASKVLTLKNGITIAAIADGVGSCEHSDVASALAVETAVRVCAGGLAAKPRIFVLNCPTVGVDVKSKKEIHDIIKKLAEQGFAIIMMSDDIPEVMSTSNRVLIMVGGKVTYESITSELSKEQMNNKILQAV